MMKKHIAALLAAFLIFAVAAAGTCETLFVDNRETDKIYPERLNLRAAPTKNGAILGLYYTGAEVNVLGVENEEYAKVEVGHVTGYMANEFLITKEEALKRYGEDSGFGSCRAAEVDLNGLWMQGIVLHEMTDPESKALATLEHGTRVGLVGILDDWAYVRADVDGKPVLGYLPLDVLTDVDELKVSIISSGKSDGKTILYDAPHNRAEEIMRLGNGTACFSLFGRKEGEWRRVRVGGVAGWIKYTQTENLHPLGDRPREVVPYYPLLMQTKGDALLYSVMGDKSQRYMTLGQGMKVEVLADCGEDYVYVRTYECGAGAYSCGDYGYLLLSDLSLAQTGESIGVAEIADSDIPAVVLKEPDAGAEVLGALCPGAQVRIVAYTQTDFVQIQMGGLRGYVPKRQIRVLYGDSAPVFDKIPQRGAVKEASDLRETPSAKGKKMGGLVEGQRVYMLGKFGDWACVRVGQEHWLDVNNEQDDQIGFVQLSRLSAPASTTHLTAFVNKDKINLRNQPSSQSGQIIGKARTGERLRVVDYGVKWTGVVLEDGRRGYLMTQYLDFE